MTTEQLAEQLKSEGYPNVRIAVRIEIEELEAKIVPQSSSSFVD